MKKVAKAILIALGIAFVVGAFVVLCVNLYIQSAGTQARIRFVLTRALRTPVKIASVTFVPWYGIRMSGITGEEINDPENEKPLEISRVSARMQLWKLLWRQVVVTELSVDDAKVTWNENAQGTWHLPAPRAGRESAESAGVPELPAQPVPGNLSTPNESPVAAPYAEPPPVTVLHCRLRNASFDFFDRNHKHIVAASGINVQSPLPTATAVNGNASISQVAIQDMFYVRDWRADFSYSPEKLSLFNGVSTIAGGKAVGRLDAKIAEPDTPFNIDVKFSEIDLARLISDAIVNGIQASGSVEGFLHIQGDLRDTRSASGSGKIAINNGRVIQSELLRSLGRVLHSDKLQQINLQAAFADFHIAGGKIFVDQLMLNSSDLSLSGQGAMDANGENLQLKSRLVVGTGISRQIPAFLMDNFAVDPATNARYIDFDVSGTISSPKTNLLKLIGRNMDYKKLEKGAGSLLRSWWGSAHKSAPPPSPPVPAPSPAVSASP